MPLNVDDFKLGDEVIVTRPCNFDSVDYTNHIGIIIDIMIGKDIEYPIEINFTTTVDIEYFKAEELKLVKDLTSLEKALYGIN